MNQSEQCQWDLSNLNQCYDLRDQKRADTIQSLIDFCGKDWGCRDELLGGFIRSDYSCEQHFNQVKNCISKGFLDVSVIQTH